MFGSKFLIVMLTMAIPILIACDTHQPTQDSAVNETITLPQPAEDGDISVEQALSQRRSIREYTGEPLTLEEVSQILWAAQGITLPSRGFRTSPSAGATFPLYIYVAVSNVTDLETGLYLYHPGGHELQKVSAEDKKETIYAAGLRQSALQEGACTFVITGDYQRTTGRYGERGVRYVHNEVGHVGQNIHLQAEALGLGTVVVGAFNNDDIINGLNLPDNKDPFYLMPVGRK